MWFGIWACGSLVQIQVSRNNLVTGVTTTNYVDATDCLNFARSRSILFDIYSRCLKVLSSKFEWGLVIKYIDRVFSIDE